MSHGEYISYCIVIVSMKIKKIYHKWSLELRPHVILVLKVEDRLMSSINLKLHIREGWDDWLTDQRVAGGLNLEEGSQVVAGGD